MEYNVTLCNKTKVKIEAESIWFAYVKALKTYRENAVGIAIVEDKNNWMITPVLDYYVRGDKSITADIVVDMLIDIKTIIANNDKKYGKFVWLNDKQEALMRKKYGKAYYNYCSE